MYIQSTWKAALLITLAATAAWGGTPAPKPHQELAQQQQTINDLRNVGTAMYVWWNDQMKPKRSEAAAQKSDAFAQKAAASPVSVDLNNIPRISRGELAKILVPKYIAAIPEKDGWGNAYEYRLETKNPESPFVMALRSPGKDGSFAGTSYQIGGFPPPEESQDLAWMDGYFIRWPQAK